MNAAFVAAIVLVFFVVGYRYYSGFLTRKIFKLNADEDG